MHSIDNRGCILEQLNVHPHIVELVASLHSSSWFRVGNSCEFIVSAKGGRQGCRFGGKLFNLVYAEAADEARRRLSDEGIVLRVPWWKGAPPNSTDTPWTPNADSRTVPVIDVFFVDDRAYALVASSLATLNSHLAKAVRIINEIFSRYAFEVNYAPGKTEALLVYRGKGSKEAKVSLAKTIDKDNVRTFSVDAGSEAPNIQLRIVQQYKHLGGFVTIDGNLAVEATNRSR